MEIYFTLTLLTVLIIFLGWKIVKKTGEWAFAIGLFFVYYWSMLGSWFLVYDDLSGGKGKDFGLQYHYMFEKLFTVHADSDYHISVFYYGLFIVVIELAVLFMVRKNGKTIPSDRIEPVYLEHRFLILAGIFMMIINPFLVWKQVLIAAKYDESIYFITRNYPSTLYTLHQLLNQISIATLFIGFISYLVNDKSRFFKGSQSKGIFWGYVFAIVFAETILLFLGNRREILFSGILGLIFYLNALEYKIHWRAGIIFGLIVILPLFFTMPFRAFKPTALKDYAIKNYPELVFEAPPVEYSTFSVSGTALSFLFSNEMFSSQFSMYGAVHFKIPPSKGNSIKYLASSLVPRAIIKERPESVYDYYIRKLKVTSKQGFTIHQATGWYLNFGIIGILLGGAIFGWIWGGLYNKFKNLQDQKRLFGRVFFTIAFAAFTAFIPSIIRTGPEGYKSLLFEALLIPSLMIFIAAYGYMLIWKRSK